MDEKKQPPEENSKPYRLQLVTGTGRVLWEAFLSLRYQKMVREESDSWSDMRQLLAYALHDDFITPTSPDSF